MGGFPISVAVTAISNTELRNNIANDLNKIAELVPQVSIGRAVTGTGAVLTVRGISSTAADSGLEQSVSLSVDGVSLGRGRIIQTAMFDMQQVEVLQGPQALFFGKNTPAGLISITTADPESVLEAHVKAGYEFEAKEKYVEGVVSGPLTTDLKARAAIRYSAMDGWIKNVAGPQANPFQPSVPLRGARQGKTQPMGNNLAGRLTFLWEPTDDFSAKLKITGNRERLNGNAAFAEEFCVGGQTIPTNIGRPLVNGSDCSLNQVVAQNSLPPEFAINFPNGNEGVPYSRSGLVLTSLTLDRKFDNITVTSTTGYYDQHHKASFNGTRDEFAQIYNAEAERYRMFNEELRFNTDFDGSINVMAGAYYEHSNRRQRNASTRNNVYDPVFGNYVLTDRDSKHNNDNYSVFGQLRWKIVPSLELAGGARYSHDDKKSRLVHLQANRAIPAGRTALPAGQVINATYSNNNVSPDVSLAWKPDPNQTLYAAFKVGYKSGGISTPGSLTSDATPASLVIGPEKAKGFEVGYKANLFANTLRMDLTAYRYNYNGLQVSALDRDTFRYTIRNAARSRTTGVTGSFQWLATDRFTFSGNFGWNRARYISFPDAQCRTGQTAAQGCVGGVQSLTGKALLRAPALTFRLAADYKADLGAGWTADLTVSGAYSSSFQTQAEYTVGGVQAAYWLLNTAVHISPESGRYRLSVVGRNLTNTYYKLVTNNRSGGTSNEHSALLNRPREVLIEATYNF